LHSYLWKESQKVYIELDQVSYCGIIGGGHPSYDPGPKQGYEMCNWPVATTTNQIMSLGHAKTGTRPVTVMSKKKNIPYLLYYTYVHPGGVPTLGRWDAVKHDYQSNCTDEAKGWETKNNLDSCGD